MTMAYMNKYLSDDYRRDELIRIISPLVHVAGLPHNLLCSIHDCHNISHIRRLGFSDDPTHVPYCLIK